MFNAQLTPSFSIIYKNFNFNFKVGGRGTVYPYLVVDAAIETQNFKLILNLEK